LVDHRISPFVPAARIFAVLASTRPWSVALFVLLLCLSASVARPCAGQQWATGLFDTREHQFGVVAKNADSSFEFKLKNTLAEPVVIRGIRSSCGCVTPRLTATEIPPQGTAGLQVKYNTDRFVGSRNATITVTFDRPAFAEVQLKVSGFIRGDVFLEPGLIDFGSAADVGPLRRSLQVEYRGSIPNWQVVDVLSSFPHVRVSLQQQQRQRGRISYSLSARLLSDIEPGRHQTELILVTNDPANRNIPVNLTVHVVEPLQVTPAFFDLGDLEPGQQVTKQILVRSSTACQIVKVLASDSSVVGQAQPGAKQLHRLPIVFTAGPQPGPVTSEVTIQTDSGSSEKVQFIANVLNR